MQEMIRRLGATGESACFGFLTNGLLALILSLLIWRLTGSFLGWLALFLPGALMVTRGVVLLWREVVNDSPR